MTQEQQTTQPGNVDFEIITREEFQNQLADQITSGMFGNEDNAEKTGNLITQFVISYEQQKQAKPLDQWLADEFRKYPSIWRDEAELESTAREIITNVQDANEAKESLYRHLEKGKSRESWLAKRIEDGATAAGVTQVGDYVQRIDKELQFANSDAYEAIYNKGEDMFGGMEVNLNPNLHGFIAEADVASRFNINASASHSGIHAEVLSSTDLNSADLVIRDSAENVLQEVQLKSYAKVDQAINNIRAHDYPDGTVLLVHDDQVERLQREFPNLRVTSKLEAAGVSSEMPSYEELKKLQQEAQLHEESRQYEWNDVNRINIAKGIAKQALIMAGISAGMHGARILGRRIWNKITGKQNPPASEDLAAFFESSIKGTKHVGVQVAVSSAVVVAVKSGLLGKVLQGTPVGKVVNAVYVGMENAKVLYKFAKGELTGAEAMDAMGNVTSSAVGGLMCATLGMAKGAAAGFAIGGPLGLAIGGFVGGVVAGMAGNKIGEAVYQASKVITKTAVSVVKNAYEGAKEAVKACLTNPLRWLAL